MSGASNAVEQAIATAVVGSDFVARGARGAVSERGDVWLALVPLKGRGAPPGHFSFAFECRIWFRPVVEFFGYGPFPPRRSWARIDEQSSEHQRWHNIAPVEEWWFVDKTCDSAEVASRIVPVLQDACLPWLEAQGRVDELQRRWTVRDTSIPPAVDEWTKAAIAAYYRGDVAEFTRLLALLEDVPQSHPRRARAIKAATRLRAL